MTDTLWQTKLHARLHDPAEKALVLLRDPAGHEGGTSRALHRSLGFARIPTESRLKPDNPGTLDAKLFANGVPVRMYRQVQRADWWAAAADRPQWPMEEITVQTKSGGAKTLKVAAWAQVRWTKQPILIHPLSGCEFNLQWLDDTDIHDIKVRSRDHFERLSVQDPSCNSTDWHRTLLAYWRFGPEMRQEDEDDGKLGLLWPLLPADTRVPDHSIWDHLDLASAFAGAFAADGNGEASLLALSLGPVQPFIAAARSTSDLWAGSHLLARLSWEAMKVLCQRLGPDAILFPRLRGIPQVDVWLMNECGIPREWFKHCEWTEGSTDSNPLFGAALPNRCVAVVPSSQARGLAEEVTARVRHWLQSLGADVVDRLLEEAGFRQSGQPRDETTRIIPAYRQMREQIDGFPEVHWAAVPFSLIHVRDKERQRNLDTAALSDAMAPFFGTASGAPCGFLESSAWQVLQRDVRWNDDTAFFAPNPGTLYPAVYDLAERVLAAAKAVRPFEQTEQHGWRCSLTGETEWLTTDVGQLSASYRQREDTLWAKVARSKPAWAKSGEHLGALPAIKRLWPTLFAEEVAGVHGLGQRTVDRFVVSTHTMALAYQLDRWLKSGREPSEALREKAAGQGDGVALPPRLSCEYRRHSSWRLAKKIPALLDAARESDDDAERRRVENLIAKEFGQDGDSGPRLEAYYALLMMDGDHMGRILSGNTNAITYRESFHPKVRQGFDNKSEGNAAVREYGAQGRATSPSRHVAISASLNDFALNIVPQIVEREHLGRVIYAGGDDVLAMLPVADLLSAMQRLRDAYSGTGPAGGDIDWKAARHGHDLVCRDGFAFLPGGPRQSGRLMRMMGGSATASCGAVIAHYRMPLAAALRELREAEQRAKNEGGRNAFSVAVLKRSGGDLRFTGKWGAPNFPVKQRSPLDLMARLRVFLAAPEVSRRAAYHCLVWLRGLPEKAEPCMLGALLRYQLNRQASGTVARSASDLAIDLANTANQQECPKRWLADMFGIAEFLARETRAPSLPKAGE